MSSVQYPHLHPLLQAVISRIDNVAGEVIVTSDNHVFFRPGVHAECFWGAMDMKKEGRAAGVRVVIRRVRKRALNSRYSGLPWFQMYVLPIVEKNANTMTDAERCNMELNRRALVMAHAIERDPEQAARYHELHEAHKRNPTGYKKLYPNFFGFLVATCRMQLAAQQVASASAESAAHSPSVSPAFNAGIRLCVLSSPVRRISPVIPARHPHYRPRAA